MSSTLRIAAVALVPLLLLPIMGRGQDDRATYEAWKKRQQEAYGNYKREQQEEYATFRKKANEEYAAFLKKHWEGFAAFKGEEPKMPKPVPPVVCPEEDRQKERKNEQRPHEDVVVLPPPDPQPQPVEPPSPPKPVEPVKPHEETLLTHFYGTDMRCTVGAMLRFSLPNLSEERIASAWKQLSDGQCEGLLGQCLYLRSRYRLSDWGYIQLLDSLSRACMKTDNDATLLMAWLYCQSGYRMRLARADGRLYMLYASEDVIYKHSYFTIGDERFYAYKGERRGEMYICNAAFPNEQNMTLRMGREPRLAKTASQTRTLQSKRYPDMRGDVSVNSNLVDFYGSYPSGYTGGDFSTRWAIYANTPLSDETKAGLYPALQKALAGKSKLQATEALLNFVQTAFVYEYDSIVWGEDRAFFPEETLFYPYADCEDRAILFSRLVRDLLGLRVVLIYYPGHLATAVRFDDEQPTGDYLQLRDGHYYVADPTYIGAPIGLTMPSCRDKKITVVEL